VWTLYRPDRNLRFHSHDNADPTESEELLAEIDRDRTSIFWG